MRLVSKSGRERTRIPIGPLTVGRDFLVIAGPCSVESEAQTLDIARAVKAGGANMLRGGAFKPRSSPYAFQGLGLKGLKILVKAREETGLPIVSEALDTRDVAWMCDYVDVIQIGARNMQNFPLLKEAGKTRMPVLLKRGMNSTLLRMAQLRRIHPQRRQRQRHPLRARHPDLRNLHPEHPRPERRPRGPGAEPSAGHRRSGPRNGPGRADRRHEPRGRGGRGRRPDRRGPQRSRGRLERSGTGADPGAVCRNGPAGRALRAFMEGLN